MSSSPDQSGRLSRLAHALNPVNWSQRVANIVFGTGLATMGVMGGFLLREYLHRRDITELRQALLAGESPATHPDINEVLRRTRALTEYLETMESGPNGVLDSVACDSLKLPPDSDLLLDPSLTARATVLAMDCPTLGQGKVSEKGVKVQDGPTLTAAGWKISSGDMPMATAVLALATNGFKVATTGVQAGNTDKSVSADCKVGIDGSFDCEVKKDGKTGRLKLAADKGRQLTGWLVDLIKEKLDVIGKKGVTAAPKAVKASAK